MTTFTSRTTEVTIEMDGLHITTVTSPDGNSEAIAQFFEQHYRDRWTDVEIVEAIRARSNT